MSPPAFRPGSMGHLMRQTEVSLSAVGFSAWVPHDVYQTPPAISLICTPSSGANLTYSVQGTGDDVSPNAVRYVGWSQTANTITVTDVGPPARGGTHGLSVGDFVLLLNGPDGVGPGGQGVAYSVATVVDAQHYTLTSANSKTAQGEAQAVTARVFVNPLINAVTGVGAKAQAQWGYPVKASRLVVSAVTVAGVVSLVVLQGENK